MLVDISTTTAVQCICAISYHLYLVALFYRSAVSDSIQTQGFKGNSFDFIYLVALMFIVGSLNLMYKQY